MYAVHHGIGAAVVSAAVALTLSGPAVARDPNADKTRIDQELTQTRALYEGAGVAVQAAMQAYTLANAHLTGAQADVAAADGVVAVRLAEARQAHENAACAQRVYDDANQRYLTAVGDLAAARDRVSTFAAEAYKGSGLLAISSVLESPTISDLAVRIGYLNQVARTQSDALAQFQATRTRAADAFATAAVARDQAAAAEQAGRSALAGAQAAQVRAAQARTVVGTVVAERAATVAVANQHRAAVLAEYRALRHESDRIAAQLRALAHPRTSRRAPSPRTFAGTMQPRSHLLTPVHGVETSGFGMRFDPYYHVWQLHAGVDLAAAGGTRIHAAAAGRVVITGWHGGNGNYTCLDNGPYRGHELSTCYAHQSRMLVHLGQRVARGETIGLVGETGAATGYHLHFEVRVDGRPVQPLNWLPSCLC